MENNEAIVTENTDAVKAEQNQQTPTVEELMAELAREKANSSKLKATNDKLSSENADWKKKLRARQTAEEQAAADREEAQRVHEEYVKGLERNIGLIEAKTRYMDLGMDANLAMQTAEAELDGDRETVMSNFRKHQDALIAAKQAEWLKSRPQVQNGNDTRTEAEKTHDSFFAAFNKY